MTAPRPVPLVLVVDDEPDIRALLELTLQHVAGWRVEVASSGTQALERVPELAPDVVLLDVMMPGLDGPETARRLAADPRSAAVPVILLTAKARPGETTALLEGPVAGVLAKPFDPIALADQIADLLGWDR